MLVNLYPFVAFDLFFWSFYTIILQMIFSPPCFLPPFHTPRRYRQFLLPASDSRFCLGPHSFLRMVLGLRPLLFYHLFLFQRPLCFLPPVLSQRDLPVISEPFFYQQCPSVLSFLLNICAFNKGSDLFICIFKISVHVPGAFAVCKCAEKGGLFEHIVQRFCILCSFCTFIFPKQPTAYYIMYNKFLFMDWLFELSGSSRGAE